MGAQITSFFLPRNFSKKKKRSETDNAHFCSFHVGLCSVYSKAWNAGLSFSVELHQKNITHFFFFFFFFFFSFSQSCLKSYQTKAFLISLPPNIFITFISVRPEEYYSDVRSCS